MLELKSSHIYLTHELAEKIFQDTRYAYVVYTRSQGQLLLTPISSSWFAKMHKPTSFLLKARNLKGDKTLAIREILIDNDLDTTDRTLEYDVVEKNNLIKVKI